MVYEWYFLSWLGGFSVIFNSFFFFWLFLVAAAAVLAAAVAEPVKVNYVMVLTAATAAPQLLVWRRPLWLFSALPAWNRVPAQPLHAPPRVWHSRPNTGS